MKKLIMAVSLQVALGISAVPTRAAISFVQEAHADSGSNSVTTFTVGFSSAVTLGDTLIAWVGEGTGCGGPTIAVADNVNGSWTAVGSPQLDPTACSQVQWFYFANSRGGTIQVTATFSASEPAAVSILEYSGIATTPYDASSGANNPSSVAITTPSVTTSSANELVLAGMGFVCCGATGNFGTVTTASPYVLRSSARLLFIAETMSTGGSTSGAQFNWQYDQPPQAVTVAFKGASGSSGGAATLVLCPNNGQTGNSANCVSPPTLGYGKQGTNTSSAALSISVNNCSTPNIAICSGSGSLTLGSPYFNITGANASDFANTGQGSCSNNLVITSGGSCTIVLRFTPTLPSGSNESATITVNSDSVSGPQTMSITGTSVSVNEISSCQALSGGINYQLTANVSASGTCFTVSSSNVDINLNGFTATYCTANQTTLVGGVMMTGWGVANTTVHNGTINEGAGTCSGLDPGNSLFGPGAVIASSSGSQSSSYGTSIFNIVTTIKANEAKVLWEEVSGASTTASTVMHDVIYTDNDSGACDHVSCRSNSQYYPIVVDQGQNGASSQFYNITGTGGTQGAILSGAPNSTFKDNLISPGNISSTNTNGFVFQAWGPGALVQNNLTTGSGAGGSCLSCRGVQVASVGSGSVNGTLVQNNVLYTTMLNNDSEYGGCEIGGSYGMQINNTNGGDVSNNTFQNNKVTVTSGVCEGYAFSWSNATLNYGPNKTINNQFICNLQTGYTAGPCAGIRLLGNQYSPHPDGAVIGQGDTYLGDTSAIYIRYEGTPSWTCKQCTFGKGNNPVGGWVMLDNDKGLPSGATSDPILLVDPSFTGGATKDSNNLQTWATNNPSLSSSYTVQWTYTVTVKGASSGNPIAGATVTATDSQSGEECSGTTNSNGIFSCVVNDSKYAATNGAYTVTSFNPFSFQVSASGCSTLNYNLIVTSTTSEMRQLGGC